MQTIEKYSEKTSNITSNQDAVKRRVGVITMFHNNLNYGGVLQAYALQTTIRNFGFTCDVIRYSKSKHTFITAIVKRELICGGFTLEHIVRICNLFNRTVKYAFDTAFEIFIQKIYLGRKMSSRKNAFSRFNSNHILSTKPYDDGTINECIKSHDIFVCGSDQIWRPGVFTPAYALGFVPDATQKIAYAPSIGVNYLTNSEIEYMQPLVNRLDAISVREGQGKELLESMTSKEVHWVLDPTLLLDHEEWKKIICPYPIEGPYVFCYMLGKSKSNKHFVLRIAEKLGIPIVTIPFVAGNYISLTYGDIQVYDAGPGEFISLIENAKYVITDSFHGSAFSIIFKKEFFVLKRSDDNNRSSMNSRVYSLLNICGLEGRLINDVESFDFNNLSDEIDYELVFARLDNQREQSLEFLVQALLRENGTNINKVNQE